MRQEERVALPYAHRGAAGIQLSPAFGDDGDGLSGDIILFNLTEGWDKGIVLTYGTNPTSSYAGEGSGPRPAARQTRPEPEAEGVISMMSPKSRGGGGN